MSALLRAGADPDIGNIIGHMPLHSVSLTLRSDSERIAVDLLDAGTEVDVKAVNGDTPLMWAACFGNIGTTRQLLLRGANRTMENMYGETSLDSVCGCEDAHGGDIQCPGGGCDQ